MKFRPEFRARAVSLQNGDVEIARIADVFTDLQFAQPLPSQEKLGDGDGRIFDERARDKKEHTLVWLPRHERSTRDTRKVHKKMPPRAASPHDERAPRIGSPSYLLK